jgi:hypothetical protein
MKKLITALCLLAVVSGANPLYHELAVRYGRKKDTATLYEDAISWLRFESNSYDTAVGGNITASNMLYSTDSISGDWSGNFRWQTAAAKMVYTNSLFKGLSALTISVWLKSNRDFEFAGILHARVGTSSDATGAREDNIASEGWITGVNGIILNRTNNVINLDTWQHFVFTWNENKDGKGRIYSNGILIDSGETGAGTTTNTITIDIKPSVGHDTQFAQRYFKGLMDDLVVWDKALTSNEVFNIYNKYKP